MIYGAKVGPVEVSERISRGICLAVMAACCALGAAVCITLPDIPLPPLPRVQYTSDRLPSSPP